MNPISAFVYSLNEYASSLINAAKPGQNVTFVFHYKWNHVKQEITIPAGTPIDLNYDWYGPAKMAELFGNN